MSERKHYGLDTAVRLSYNQINLYVNESKILEINLDDWDNMYTGVFQ